MNIITTNTNTILRYAITWNEDETNVFFSNHIEAKNFFDECDKFGDEVIVHKCENVTAEDIIADNTLSNAEIVEYLAMILLPDTWKMLPKYTMLENEMKRLGLIA